MARIANHTDHYSSSHISISYDIKDNFPFMWAALPDASVQAMQKAARQALDYTYGKTPYLEPDPRSTVHLRDSTFIQTYRNGAHGGTVYVQWRATNSETGYHYGINQEYGNNLTQGVEYTYTNGTGPGFMAETWSIIEQAVPFYIQEAVDNLTKENSV